MGKAKIKPSKESVNQATKVLDMLKSRGLKIISLYWTLGRYDYVLIFEAENAEEAMKTSLANAEFMSTETLTAIPREEAVTLV